MTTAESQEARTGPSGWPGRAWRGFRRWRRQRPFWGGLFTMLAGLVIFGSTQMSLNGLVFKMGPTGFLTWLIPAILFTCGLLFWFSPAQRTFYAVVTAVTAVYSLIGVNLGGFFLGLLLGMVGSALGFAWVPSRTPAPRKTEEPPATTGADEESGEESAESAGDDAARVDELMPRQRAEEPTGVLADVPPPPRNPLREPAPAEPTARSGTEDTRELPDVDPQPPAHGRHRDPKTYAILLVVTVSAAAGLVGFRPVEPAVAAPGCPRPTVTATPTAKPTTPNSPSPSASSGTPTPDEPSDDDGNLLTDIVDGITGLLTGDDADDGNETPASTTTRPGGDAAATSTPPGGGEPRPGTSSKPGKPARDTCGKPTPGRPKPVQVGKPLPRVSTDSDVPIVAAKPGKLTGSKQTMTGLHFAGIAELDTADGKLRTLMFTMEKAVTNDFVLKVGGPQGKTVRYVTEQLVVRGDVAFYATRYVGRLAGVKVTLTPDLPFPDGIPVTSPVPITFTDVEIDLAYIDCDTLTANTRGPLHIDLA
ncbi:hypothetical protein E1211_27095 [Micromonospora sp. 15K316]|uniref:DUF6114 domain-containing protein n=1 Tax=Micromonospora sp. 15K316 TaxID=2530376 RepID=UPI001045E61D|nr:DUF6114 domain-containing protein [Micromonospora sp. 15K316]TDC28868.1 hypothetical protein E1211_27095 [Micromonospora sp. 15K316]